MYHHTPFRLKKSKKIFSGNFLFLIIGIKAEVSLSFSISILFFLSPIHKNPSFIPNTFVAEQEDDTFSP